MKNKLFTTGLAFSMLCGIALSLSTQDAMAQNELTDADSEITCWSAGTAPLISFRRYVECSSCLSVKGKATGGQGTCSTS